MTQELYEADRVVHMVPMGLGATCACAKVNNWNFWPQHLNFANGCVEGSRALCGTRANPGLYAYQTLIWAYCASCKGFFGGIFKSR